MIDPKARPQSEPEVLVVPTTVPSQDTIRERAYVLYESRGCEPGQAERDWLRAEQEILNQYREGTTSNATRASAGRVEG